MKEFALSEWRKARMSLASARQLVESDPDSSASRPYYAAFHALTAYFALRDQSFGKHSALRAAVHRDLVRPGLFAEAVGHDFDYLATLRGAGDYGRGCSVSVDGARAGTEMAAAIIEAVAAAEQSLMQ